jgi:hypothetical protein
MSKEIISVSRIPIIVTLNNEVKLKGELIRHLSPLTIKKIINILPINQLINNYQNKVIQIKVNLDIGVEKPQNRFKKGDIAFAPIANSIYIFLADYNNNQPLSHVGFIKIDALDELAKTKAGDVLSIQRIL